jgi:predicted dehydrogenase
LRDGTFDNDAAKEEMRFGAVSANAASNGSTPNPVGTRAHIGWFGVTVASFERGDVRQSPNGLYVYDAAGRREIPVSGGRGTGMLEMREMFECLNEGIPIVHDGRWALATLEVGMAIGESARERREIVLRHQCGIHEA